MRIFLMTNIILFIKVQNTLKTIILKDEVSKFVISIEILEDIINSVERFMGHINILIFHYLNLKIN